MKDPVKKPVRVVPCEIYSRVVGYYSSVRGWNPGKRSEFLDRVPYRLPAAIRSKKEKD